MTTEPPSPRRRPPGVADSSPRRRWWSRPAPRDDPDEPDASHRAHWARERAATPLMIATSSSGRLPRPRARMTIPWVFSTTAPSVAGSSQARWDGVPAIENPAAATELEQALVAQQPQGAQHRVHRPSRRRRHAPGVPATDNPAAAAELEQTLVAQQPQGTEHRVGVHPEHRGEVLGRREPLPGPRLARRRSRVGSPRRPADRGRSGRSCTA